MSAGLRRVSHGLFLPVRPVLTDEEEFRRDLSAWMLVLPEGAVFTHLTAARLRGWRLPSLPEQVPVFAAVRGTHRRPRRPGMICSRLVEPGAHPAAPEMIDGLPVDAAGGGPAPVFTRPRPPRPGRADRLGAGAGTHRPGPHGELCSPAAGRESALCARRTGVADQRSESGGETVSADVPRRDGRSGRSAGGPRRRGGRLLGRADLLVTGTGNVHEYDGSGHRKRDQQRSDLRRERRWPRHPYVRRGFTLDDLLNHPGVVMHELDRALDGPIRPIA